MIVTHGHAGGRKDLIMDNPRDDFRALHIEPALTCAHYAGCTVLTSIALAERTGRCSWQVQPVCPEHGYASHGLYGTLAELASIVRFVADQKHVLPELVRVLAGCNPQEIPDWTPDPDATFETLAWRLVYQPSAGDYREVFVSWSFDFLEFELHEATVLAV